MPAAQLDAPAPTRDVLTRDEAAGRAARVGAIAYDIALALTGEDTTYRGEARLAFAVRGAGDLFLDFRGGTIERLEVNGTARDRPDRPGAPDRPARGAPGAATRGARRLRERLRPRRRRLPPLRRPGGRRESTSTPTSSRSRPTGSFPCFDQPDLKGTLRVTRDGARPSWAVDRPTPRPSAVDAASDGRRDAPLRHHAADLHVPCGGDRGPVRRASTTRTAGSRSGSGRRRSAGAVPGSRTRSSR